MAIGAGAGPRTWKLDEFGAVRLRFAAPSSTACSSSPDIMRATSLPYGGMAEFLRARNFDYVRAAKALGVSNTTIMFRHLLPNATVATVTFLPFNLSAAVTVLSGLDFLGFGLPPGSASLGEMVNQGRNNLQAPWLGLTSFFTLAIMLSLLVFVGEAIRDSLDPRKTFIY